MRSVSVLMPLVLLGCDVDGLVDAVAGPPPSQASSTSAPYIAPEPVYVPPPPMPNWVIGSTELVDCGGLFSDCSRASCTVINAGDGGGSVNIEIEVTSESGQSLTHGETLYLDPGDRKTIMYDFAGFDASSGECRMR